MSTQAAVPALGTASRAPIQRRRRVTELVLLLLALALAVGANFLVDPERFAEDSGHVLRTAIVLGGGSCSCMSSCGSAPRTRIRTSCRSS